MPMPITKDTLRDVGKYILEGMTEKESCVLADISYNELQHIKEDNEQIRSFIDKKHIEFKHNHIKEIQKNKSEKNSQWLLEKLRPDEFGAKAHKQESPTINIISAIIKDIQNNNEENIISRGNRIIEASESNEKDREQILIGGGTSILE